MSRYPSPSLLLAAYAKCGSVKEGQELLQGLEVRTRPPCIHTITFFIYTLPVNTYHHIYLVSYQVRRTDNVLGGTRRVGPDISRRIHTVFTSRDGEKLITAKQ